MNTTQEPDYIEKGFQKFGKLNKNLSNTIDNTNKLITERVANAASQSTLRNSIGPQGFVVIIIGIFIAFMMFTSNYAMSMTTDTTWLSIPILLLVGYGLYAGVTSGSTANNWISSALKITTMVTFSMVIASHYVQVSQETSSAASYMYSIVSVLFLFVSMAILFYFAGEYIKRLEGLPGLVIQFLFYIPCLLLQFISYIKKEYNDTTSTVIYLFVAELLLVLLYVYLPKITKHLFMKKGIKLLPGNAFLDTPQVIANSEKLKMESTNTLDTLPVYRRNYATSFWLYLNDQGSNYKAYSKEANIFNYAGGAPHVVYENNIDEDNGRSNLVIYYTNRDSKSKDKIKIKIKKQKWNHFVFNYSYNYLDVFVNGKLEKSVSLEKIEPKYTPYDNITIGDNNGLDGAICNITYYKVPLSKRNITNEYNLLAHKNPPIETEFIPKI